ncbi:MAG: nucleoside recognition protein [Lachnospiraceae bacterium]|nr:nucleoside recognition protein [Lachnospiraceae bacterium]
MLDILWSFLILIGIAVAAITGNIEAVSTGILASAKDAIELLIVMAGVVAMWNGFLYIADGSDLTRLLARKMKPLLKFLFPSLPQDHIAGDYICANFIANMLGLGWACTPTGLSAMKALKELEQERLRTNINHSDNSFSKSHKQLSLDTASDEMCTFLILNISSLQLIPMNLIAYRSQYGSPQPMAVIIPGLITTTLTTVIAIIICKVMCHRQ